ncbi:MAG TPA: class I SAM-dependent methyltransferase [Burkholderiaceae bacterium]|nr:class I SAM-dependent methyltransferase [Burkholderiaceae bacterium]
MEQALLSKRPVHLTPEAYVRTDVDDGLQIARNDDFQREIEDAFDALDRLAALRLLAAFQAQGLFVNSATRIARTALNERVGVVESRLPLMEALLDILTRAGLITQDGDELVSTLHIASPDVNTVLREPAHAIARQKEQHHDTAGFCDLLEACLPGLFGVLSGTVRATDLLFAGGSTDLVEAVYKRNRLAHFSHLLVAEATRSHASHRLQTAGAGQRLRILEVGAGTGATTRPLLQALNHADVDFEYWFTDISAGFLFKAKPCFSSHPELVFRTLDVEKDFAKQGFGEPIFDVVIASNVLHATRDVGRTLQRVHNVLRPDGLLVLSELTRRLDVLTLTFGLLDGWWLFADAERRMPHCPLLDGTSWQLACVESGFRSAQVGGSLPGRRLPQSLVKARP